MVYFKPHFQRGGFLGQVPRVAARVARLNPGLDESLPFREKTLFLPSIFRVLLDGESFKTVRSEPGHIFVATFTVVSALQIPLGREPDC